MKKNITLGLEEFLPRIKSDISQKFFISTSFLVLMLIFRLAVKIPLPDALFFLVSFLVLSFVFIDLIFSKISKDNPKTAINYYFIYLIFELLIIALIIHFIGGIAWAGSSFFLFYIISFFWLISERKAIFLVGWVCFLLILLVANNYYGFFPSVEIFTEEEANIQNFSFVFTLTVIALAFIGFLGYSSYNFYGLLDRKINELKKKGRELSFIKKSLEIEVQERTKELQLERKKAEEEVIKRTVEFEEKKKFSLAKVKELEKFHKAAVERELKMSEIKEKIKKLKKLESQE